MSIFNSLGSNYDKDYLRGSLKTDKHALDQLRATLRKRYKAQDVRLVHKGREAICLGLQHASLQPGAKVAISGYTCFAVYEAVIAAGLKPILIDITGSNLNFTAAALEQALKQHDDIGAVIIQNTLGVPCEIEKIKAVCDDHDLLLMEDLAHSVGVTYKDGAEAGTVGDLTALSFSQDKMVDGVSGGALVIRNKDIHPPLESTFKKVPSFMVGRDRNYPFATKTIRKTHLIGIGKVILKSMKALHLLPRPMDGGSAETHRLSRWYADRTNHAFEQLEATQEHRNKIAEIYRKIIPKSVQFKHEHGSVYLRFPVSINDRAGLISRLRGMEIHLADIWYDAPIGPRSCLSKTNYNTGDCPAAELVAQRMLNLPTHVHVSEKDAELIAQEVAKWVR